MGATLYRSITSEGKIRVTQFRGKLNLVLGDGWAKSEYDVDSGEYVVDVQGGAVKKFRDVADEYGYVEVDAPADEAKPAAKPAEKK